MQFVSDTGWLDNGSAARRTVRTQARTYILTTWPPEAGELYESERGRSMRPREGAWDVVEVGTGEVVLEGFHPMPFIGKAPTKGLRRVATQAFERMLKDGAVRPRAEEQVRRLTSKYGDGAQLSLIPTAETMEHVKVVFQLGEGAQAARIELTAPSSEFTREGGTGVRVLKECLARLGSMRRFGS